jgi:DNA-binding HxlR family transcriptional regulator
MAEAGYNQFCPVAMAAEVLCTRWTVIVLRELMAGSTRFNALRRGLPRMSPALLSKRLKDLEAAGVVKRSKAAGEPGAYDYALTPAGKELKPVVEAIGVWGHRWVQTESSLDNLDPNLLMWDMRRNISVDPMPRRRSTIQVILSDQPDSKRNWWLIVQPGQETDLCSVDPGFDVDLFLVASLRTMTEIWMGYTTVARAKADDKLVVTGDAQLAANLQAWLGLSPFAKGERQVA